MALNKSNNNSQAHRLRLNLELIQSSNEVIGNCKCPIVHALTKADLIKQPNEKK